MRTGGGSSGSATFLISVVFIAVGATWFIGREALWRFFESAIGGRRFDRTTKLGRRQYFFGYVMGPLVTVTVGAVLLAAAIVRS